MPEIVTVTVSSRSCASMQIIYWWESFTLHYSKRQFSVLTGSGICILDCLTALNMGFKRLLSGPGIRVYSSNWVGSECPFFLIQSIALTNHSDNMDLTWKEKLESTYTTGFG